MTRTMPLARPVPRQPDELSPEHLAEWLVGALCQSKGPAGAMLPPGISMFSTRANADATPTHVHTSAVEARGWSVVEV